MTYLYCNVLLVDIVGFSKMASKSQAEAVTTLFETWREHSTTTAERTPGQVLIPTGDGFIAVIPAGQSTVGVFSLLRFVDSVIHAAQQNSPPFTVRFGLHHGSCLAVRIAEGLMEPGGTHNNFLGYTLNYVARLASCAHPGQVIASTAALERIESEGRGSPQEYDIWRDSFRVTFKGDRLFYSRHDREVGVEPSMSSALDVVDDERVVHRLIGRYKNDPDKPRFGTAAPPVNAVQSMGTNNYHAKGAVGRTNFQLAPDTELFSAYRNQDRLAVLSAPPFLERLPFAVLFSAGDDGNPVHVLEDEKDVTWSIDPHSCPN